MKRSHQQAWRLPASQTARYVVVNREGEMVVVQARNATEAKRRARSDGLAPTAAELKAKRV